MLKSLLIAQLSQLQGQRDGRAHEHHAQRGFLVSAALGFPLELLLGCTSRVAFNLRSLDHRSQLRRREFVELCLVRFVINILLYNLQVFLVSLFKLMSPDIVKNPDMATKTGHTAFSALEWKDIQGKNLQLLLTQSTVHSAGFLISSSGVGGTGSGTFLPLPRGAGFARTGRAFAGALGAFAFVVFAAGFARGSAGFFGAGALVSLDFAGSFEGPFCVDVTDFVSFGFPESACFFEVSALCCFVGSFEESFCFDCSAVD